MGIMEALLSFIRRQVGLRTDGASASGSLHAKVADIKENAIGDPADSRNDNTIMGWLSSPIKNIQRGVISITSGTTASLTITAVDPKKTIVSCLGQTGYASYIALINSTTITLSRSESGSYTSKASFEVIEFY